MGVYCESEAKKSSCEFFRKSLFELKFLPAGMYIVHTLKYIGVKLPPNSTKFVHTVDR